MAFQPLVHSQLVVGIHRRSTSLEWPLLSLRICISEGGLRDRSETHLASSISGIGAEVEPMPVMPSSVCTSIRAVEPSIICLLMTFISVIFTGVTSFWFYYVVTAPREAEDTSLAYFAITPES